MDQTSIEFYNEGFNKAHSRYRELRRDYGDCVNSPDGLPPDDPLERALDAAETALLEYPPLSEKIDPDGKPTGVIAPKGKGLITGPPRILLPKSKPFRSNFKVLEPGEWTPYLGGEDAVDGRNYVPDGMVLDQDGVGSCASEGCAGVVMKCRVQMGQKPIKLQPWFLYHWASGGRDGGSTLHDNVALAQEKGIPSQDVMPRSDGWRPEPSDKAKEDALQYRLDELWHVSDWPEFGSALLYFGGVYFGYSGHAIWATKLLDKSRIEYCNSWSPEWGDNGFGTLNKSRIVWGYGCYCFRLVRRSED